MLCICLLVAYFHQRWLIIANRCLLLPMIFCVMCFCLSLLVPPCGNVCLLPIFGIIFPFPSSGLGLFCRIWPSFLFGLRSLGIPAHPCSCSGARPCRHHFGLLHHVSLSLCHVCCCCQLPLALPNPPCAVSYCVFFVCMVRKMGHMYLWCTVVWCHVQQSAKFVFPGCQ